MWYRVQLSVPLFVRPSFRPSTIHVKVLYSGAVIAGSMKPCIVITLGTLFKQAPWPGVLDLYYTPGIYAEGYIVFVFPFVCSSVRMFVRSFVRSYFLPSRGIFLQVLRLSFSSGVYLSNYLSESIHIWTIVTLEGWQSLHDPGPQGPCLCPQLWKSGEHIAFGLSVRACVRACVRPSVQKKKNIKLGFWNFIYGFLVKK